MTKSNLANFVGGWFVGKFTPTLINTEHFEVAIKHYKAGQSEPTHHHKIAQEVTVIVSGTATMNGVTYNSGDIVHLQPNENANFVAITDVVTCVVKTPSVSSDKYVSS